MVSAVEVAVGSAERSAEGQWRGQRLGSVIDNSPKQYFRSNKKSTLTAPQRRTVKLHVCLCKNLQKLIIGEEVEAREGHALGF